MGNTKWTVNDKLMDENINRVVDGIMPIYGKLRDEYIICVH